MLNANTTIQNGNVITFLLKSGMSEYAIQKTYEKEITPDDFNELVKEIKKQFNVK